MALNIKNVEVERLAAEVAELTGETKTEAIRRALLERRAKLRFRVADGDRLARVHRFLAFEIWPRVPRAQLGSAPDKAGREAILGYGEDGV